jgi:uncharacterized protein
MHLSKYNVLIDLDEHRDVCVLQNLFHGAVSLVPRALGEKIRDVERKLCTPSSTFSESDVAFLLDRRYAYQSQADEHKLIEVVYKLFSNVLLAKNATRKYQLLLTYNCNLRCAYCFQKQIRSPLTMTEGQLSQVLSYILAIERENDSEARRRNLPTTKPQISIVGGEPLLPSSRHRSLVADIIRFCKTNGFEYTITTNGVTLSDYLAEFECLRPRNVQVTVDGVASIHDKRRVRANGDGSFAEITTGVDDALMAGVHVSVRMNVDQMNLGCIVPLAHYFQERGWVAKPNFSAYLAPVTDHSEVNQDYGWISRDATTLHCIVELFRENPELEFIYTMKNFRGFELVRRAVERENRLAPTIWRCEAVMGQLVFDPTGAVFTCFEGAGNPKAQVGRCGLDLQLDQRAMDHWSRLDAIRSDTCNRCRYRFVCAGGCPWHIVGQGRPECLPILEELRIAWNYFADRVVPTSKVRLAILHA